MAATGEWAEIPFILTSPYGQLVLNDTAGLRFVLIPSGCDMGAPLRVQKDNVPQGDGSILHRRFEEGYQCQLTLMFWRDKKPACGEDLRIMLDELNKHVRGLLNAGDNAGRLSWTPSGGVNARMIDDIRLLERLQVQAPSDGRGTIASFTVDSAYPYAQDLAQTTTALNATITNTGTCPYWPVFKVYGGGPWTISNTTYAPDKEIKCNFPAFAGTYIEVDTFRNTMYVDGDQANAISGLDMELSEFFPLDVGTNNVLIAGDTADMLWAPAWT